jgi:hypothetical protein
MTFNFNIIKKITFQKFLATHYKSGRDPPVWETLPCMINISWQQPRYLWTCDRQVFGSNLSLDTSQTNCGFVVFSVLPGK